MDPYESNKKLYQSRVLAQQYSAKTELSQTESELFSRFIPPNSAILDLGVGGGRTTGALISTAARYIAIDYSAPMIEACRAKFPLGDFRVADAAVLDGFEDGSFDVVLFSFNGIDYLHPMEMRRACIARCAELLRPGGVLIFSTHNSRHLALMPDLRGVGPLKAFWRVGYAAFRSFCLAPRRLLTGAFWIGYGYFYDDVHGGLVTFSSTPRVVRDELAALGLLLIDSLGDSPYPKVPLLFQPWIYYVAMRPGEAGQ